MMLNGTLHRITAPHFAAGIVIDEDRVVHTAPILRYMMSWSEDEVTNYCHNKGWKMEVVLMIANGMIGVRADLLKGKEE
jgi:hypothetical protein